jgi:hypothetical protein
MAWPVTKLAAGEQSQTTASAISSAVPMRPIGVIESIIAFISGLATSGAVIGVSITPGHTALTRMPALRPAQRAVAGKADDAVLGRDIGGLCAIADEAVDRGGVDDRAAAVLPA